MKSRLRPNRLRALWAGALACGIFVGGCGIGPRRAPAPRGASSGSPSTSTGMAAGSSTATGGSSASTSTAAVSGAEYAQYYRTNGTAAIVAGAPLTMWASDFAFSPNALAVRVGTRVHLNVDNASPEAHNFTLEAFGVNVNLPPDTTTPVSFIPSRTGTYYFYCNLPGHAQAGMVGRLTVS